MAEPITDDETLLRAARAGDAGALAHLQRRHLPGLWDLAVRCTLDEYAAKDVVREVFLRDDATVEAFAGVSQLTPETIANARETLEPRWE